MRIRSGMHKNVSVRRKGVGKAKKSINLAVNVICFNHFNQSSGKVSVTE